MRFLSRIFSKSSLKYWFLLLVFIASSWPLFQPGMFKIHDFTHGARIAEMARGLQDYHFPVRWSQNFGFGYGMPLFQFYAPLPFYIGAIFYLLGLDLVLSVKFLFIITNFFTLLGAYFLGKKLFKTELASIATALAFTLAPYRFLNLYVRGAVSELWGMMVLPWIIWSGVRVIRREKWGWVWLILSLSILFLSHNISTMIYLPFIIGFLVIYQIIYCQEIALSWSELKLTFKKLFSAGLLATGLSAFYLLPAYFEKHFTQVEKFILAEYFDFRIHFLYLKQFFRPNWGYGGSEYGPDDPITFFLGYGQLLGLLIAVAVLVSFFWRYWSKRKKISQSDLVLPLGIFLLLTISIFITLPASLFIWENLQILEFVQFPWRFLGVVILFLALITGWAVNQSQFFLRKKKLFNLVFAFIIIGSLILNLRFTQPELFLKNPNEYYYADAHRIRTEMSQVLPDYVPQGFNLEMIPATSLVMNEEELLEEEMKITVDKANFKVLQTSFDQSTRVDFAVAYYPGWIGLQNNYFEPSVNEESGTIFIDVDPEKRGVFLKFGRTPLRFFSDVASLISLLVILILVLKEFKSRKINYGEK